MRWRWPKIFLPQSSATTLSKVRRSLLPRSAVARVVGRFRCPHCKQSNKLRADSKNTLTCFHCRKNIQLSTIGNYWVLEELGAGGFGRVYRGYEPSLDREVAIKVLHSNIDTMQSSAICRLHLSWIKSARD